MKHAANTKHSLNEISLEAVQRFMAWRTAPYGIITHVLILVAEINNANRFLAIFTSPLGSSEDLQEMEIGAWSPIVRNRTFAGPTRDAQIHHGCRPSALRQLQPRLLAAL
jgi:hypothetical protein